jgi:hypothetical protein
VLTQAVSAVGGASFAAEGRPDGPMIDALTGQVGGVAAAGGDRLVAVIARNAGGISRRLARFFVGPFVVSWGREAIAVAAGDDHTLAVRRDGSVGAWGRNDSGQTDVPSDLHGVTAVAAGRGWR